jgi:hypothetical protein
MNNEPMQQQKRVSLGILPVLLQGEVYAHELDGKQVITFCSDPDKVDRSNILCTIGRGFSYDTQRIIADNIQHALNWERGHR